jgi:integrase/recombinase XerD
MTGGRFRSKTVEDFLNNFTSSSTIRGYRCHLKDFFETIDKDPEQYIIDVRKLDYIERLDVLEEYEKDIKKFWKKQIEKRRAPKTVSNATNCIRVFLKQYRIRLDDIVWENIRRRGTGNKPVTKEEPITKEMLKEILIHGDAKAKAMFLVLASSGMRIGELVKLKMDDVNTDSKPTEIIVRYDGPDSVKNKSSRKTFISDEATVALKEWMKQRNNSLNLAAKRTNFPNVHKKVDNNNVFPFRENNVRNIWNGLIEKAGYNEKDRRTGRYTVHVHGLRKYFRTRFSRHNRDVAEILMGHEGYLGGYRKFTQDELKEEYLQGMNHLLVFETSVNSEDLKNLQKEFEENKRKLEEANKKIDVISKNLYDNPDLKTMILNTIAEYVEKE